LNDRPLSATNKRRAKEQRRKGETVTMESAEAARPRRTRRSETTRQIIIDAAERCLAEGDFDGVSLRTITEAAGVDLALVNYHFGSKDNLVAEVIERRARLLHEARVLALEEARHRAGSATPSVEAIVTAFIEPWFSRLASGDQGWRAYNRLLCQLSMMPKYLPLTSSVLDPTALHFINALRAALPRATAEGMYWGYFFLLGPMMQVMAGTGRIERLSRGMCRLDEMDKVLANMVPFVAGGLYALENATDTPPAASLRLVDGDGSP
jgi:AcrR family transcriptional regulator